jgi:hypothetical protein
MNSIVTGQRSNQLNYSRNWISRYNPKQNILHQKNIKKLHTPKPAKTRQHPLKTDTQNDTQN